jgi:hypothetical protein
VKEAEGRGFLRVSGTREVSEFAGSAVIAAENLAKRPVDCGARQHVIPSADALAGSSPMRPKQSATEPQEDLFRARLETLVDPRHALVRLAGLIDWGRFEVEFGALYTDGGRPGLPMRLMVGLHC